MKELKKVSLPLKNNILSGKVGSERAGTLRFPSLSLSLLPPQGSFNKRLREDFYKYSVDPSMQGFWFLEIYDVIKYNIKLKRYTGKSFAIVRLQWHPRKW